MAGEVQFNAGTGLVTYFLVRNRTGQVWNGSAFESYLTANYTTYATGASEQGSASGFYIGTFPAAIVAGPYSVVAKQQLGGSAAETDPTLAVGNLDWNGSATATLSDTSTSGQVSQSFPMIPARGRMIQSFPFKLVSSTDHVTPLTSGIVSGQISRDGAAFGALQSGTFTEIGLGWYKVTLTSGDMLANTAALVFNGVGVSGGVSDSRDFSFALQRTSGQ